MGKQPPALPGEYRICRDNEILYIGETNNLRRRINEHRQSGKLPADDDSYVRFMVADKRSSSRTRRMHEQQKIEQHKPSLNKSAGGEGRIAKR
jgi:predicted GIY-YIG superfamily endonuclease